MVSFLYYFDTEIIMKKIVRIIQGVLSALLMLVALGYLLDNPITGLVAAIGAVLVWPHVSDFVAQKIGKKWAAPVAGALIVVFVAPIVSFAVTPLTEEQVAERQQQKAETEKTKAEAKAKREVAAAENDAKRAKEKADRDARNKAEIAEIRAQRMAREFVIGALKDPDSAQFRNQRGFCGEVNSKNSLGGYVGFKRFIAPSADLVAIEGNTISGSEFRKAWSQACN